MSEKMHESMSALMDGEATDFEVRRLLEQMDTPQMREKWARYQVVSAAMKRDSAAMVPQIDISAAVGAAIANEESGVLAPRKSLRAVTGFASAAAIAFVAVIGMQSLDRSGGPGSLDTAVASVPVDVSTAKSTRDFSAQSPVTLVSAGSAGGARQSGLQEVALNAVPDRNTQSRLEGYMAKHAELAGDPATTQAAAPAGHWQARWLPEGYRLVAVNNAAGETAKPELTSVYSNGLSAFSVFVSSAQDGAPGAMDMRRGNTIACSRRIQAGGAAYTATVVGDISQPAAERIATSVYQSAR